MTDATTTAPDAGATSSPTSDGSPTTGGFAETVKKASGSMKVDPAMIVALGVTAVILFNSLSEVGTIAILLGGGALLATLSSKFDRRLFGIGVVLMIVAGVMALAQIEGVTDFVTDLLEASPDAAAGGEAAEVELWDLPPWVLAFMGGGVLAIGLLIAWAWNSSAKNADGSKSDIDGFIRVVRALIAIAAVMFAVGVGIPFLKSVGFEGLEFPDVLNEEGKLVLGADSIQKLGIYLLWNFAALVLIGGVLTYLVGMLSYGFTGGGVIEAKAMFRKVTKFFWYPLTVLALFTLLWGGVNMYLGEENAEVINEASRMRTTATVLEYLGAEVGADGEVKLLMDETPPTEEAPADDRRGETPPAAAPTREYFDREIGVLNVGDDPVSKWVKPDVAYTLTMRNDGPEQICLFSSPSGDLHRTYAGTSVEFSLKPGLEEQQITLEVIKEGESRPGGTCGG